MKYSIAILLALAPALVLAMDCTYTCPDGWYLWEADHTCLGAFTEGQAYTDAQGSCVEEGGDLVMIDSDDKNEFTMLVMGGSVSIWIGVWDENHNQQWTYVNGSPLTYTNWLSGEPNNHKGGEACGLIWKGKNGQWNDGKCGDKLPYVCQKPAIRTDVEPTEFPNSCTLGWSYYAPSDTCIKLFTTPASFDDARDACSTVVPGADLIIPDSPNKMTLVDELLEEDISVWVGIYDEHHNEQWTYVDGSPVTYDRWLPNEPNNSGGREACGFIWANKGGFWNDGQCGETIAYFCEVSAATMRDSSK